MCDMNVSIGSKFAYVIFNYCMAAVRRYRLLIYVRFDHTRRTTGVGTSEPVFSANRTSALIKQLPYRYTLATGRNQLKPAIWIADYKYQVSNHFYQLGSWVVRPVLRHTGHSLM